MAERIPLNKSLMRLAALPAEPVMTRAQWVNRFDLVSVTGLIAAVPDPETYILESGWNMRRVGSFWRRDEEMHVYAMEHALAAMVVHRRSNPGSKMAVMTPIFVFRRQGNRAVPVGGAEPLRTASRNFMHYFDECYKRWNPNG